MSFKAIEIDQGGTGAKTAEDARTALGAGDVSAAANLTDNFIVRGNGGAKGVQTNTAVSITDSGVLKIVAATPIIQYVDSDVADTGFFQYAAGAKMYFAAATDAGGNAGNLMTLDRASGNLGIGQTSPINPLDVKDSVASGIVATFKGSTNFGFTMTTNGLAPYNQNLGVGGGEEISFTSGVTEIMRLTDAGNVGIGTTAPNELLTLNEGKLAFRTDGGAGNNTRARIEGLYQAGGSGFGGALAFNTTTTQNIDTERMRITNSGRVGIGIVSPANNLHVFDSASSGDTNALILDRAGGASTNEHSIRFDFSTVEAAAISAILSSGTDTALSFKTNTLGGSNLTEKMRIDHAGNVGIGTDTPLAKLDVRGLVQFRETTNTGAQELLSLKTSYAGDSAQKALTWRDASNITGQIDTRYTGTTMDMVFGHLFNSGYQTDDLMTIKGNGNVGIGTTAPTHKLEVTTASGAADTPVVKFRNTDTPGNNGNVLEVQGGANSNLSETFQVKDFAGNVDFVIKGDGDVGIGTDTPSSKLHVKIDTVGGDVVSDIGNATVSASNKVGFAIQEFGVEKVALRYYRDASGLAELSFANNLNLNGDNLGIGTTTPNSKLQVAGSLSLKRTATAVSANSGDETIIGVTSTAAARTITLRTADTVDGRYYEIKDESGAAGTNNITIATEGAQTIDGAATITISANRGIAKVYSDGTNWHTR